MTLSIEVERVKQMYGVTMHLKYRREIINQLNSCKEIENCGERVTKLHGD